MVRRKSVLLMLQPNPTRVWDTFAEPNNLTMPSVAFIQNQASSCHLAWPRPKSRLTEEGCGCWQLKTCLYGVQKHLAKSSGLFFFLELTGASVQFNVPPQYLQWIASASWPSFRQCGQTCVVICFCFWKTISADTIPVGTAMIPYPKIIMKEANVWPNAVWGAISP